MSETLTSAELQRRLAEIDRELLTKAPTTLRQAVLLHEAKEVYETLHPDTRRGGDHKSHKYRENIKEKKLSFCSDAALRLGVSARAVTLAIEMADRLIRLRLVEVLNETRHADNALALRTIAEAEPEDRRLLLSIISEHPKLPFPKVLSESGLRRERNLQEAIVESVIARLPQLSPRALLRIREAVDAELTRKTRKKAA